MWFLVAGLGQNVLTPLVIGQESFGTFKRALAFVNVLNNVVVVASIQAVSRAIAAAPADQRPATLRRATWLHAGVGVGLATLFFAAVPLIAWYQHAPQLMPVLRLLALILVAYGVYAPLIGGLNGVGAFGRQAALDATYSTLRTVLIAGVGALFVARGLGGGAVGATVGFVVAAALIIPVALAAVRWRGGTATELAPRAHLSFLGDLALAQLFQALLLQVDLVLLGRMATLRGLAQGLDDVAARAAADRLAGLYAQAQAFGLVPYQILLAGAYVLFPAIAAARARRDDGALRDAVRSGGQGTLLVAGALVAAVGATPLAVLRFAFGRGAAGSLPIDGAAPILGHLALGHGCTAIAMVGITLFAAAGRARTAAMLAAAVAAWATLGAWLGGELLGGPLDEGVSLGAHLSLGLAVGLLVGATLVVVAVHRAFGPYVRAASLARVVVGVALAFVAGRFVPVPSMRLACALVPVVPLVVYAVAVALLGEPWPGRRAR